MESYQIRFFVQGSDKQELVSINPRKMAAWHGNPPKHRGNRAVKQRNRANGARNAEKWCNGGCPPCGSKAPIAGSNNCRFQFLLFKVKVKGRSLSRIGTSEANISLLNAFCLHTFATSITFYCKQHDMEGSYSGLNWREMSEKLWDGHGEAEAGAAPSRGVASRIRRAMHPRWGDYEQ